MTAGYETARRVLSRFGGLLKRAGFWLLDSWRQYFVAMSISYLVAKPTTRSEALFVGTRHRDYLKDTIVRLWDRRLMEGVYILDFCPSCDSSYELGFAERPSSPCARVRRTGRRSPDDSSWNLFSTSVSPHRYLPVLRPIGFECSQHLWIFSPLNHEHPFPQPFCPHLFNYTGILLYDLLSVPGVVG